MASAQAEHHKMPMLTDPIHKAARRRGRFVFKLGAALFLFGLSELEENRAAGRFQSPGEMSHGMAYLWGHQYIARWYAQHHSEGQWLCQRAETMGVPPALIRGVDMPSEGRVTDQPATDSTSHTACEARVPESLGELRDRLWVAMEGAWKEELGWLALAHPITHVRYHYGLYASTVHPLRAFVYEASPACDATDSDTPPLHITLPLSHTARAAPRQTVCATWQSVDRLNELSGVGFGGCWRTLLPFFVAQTHSYLDAAGLTEVAVPDGSAAKCFTDVTLTARETDEPCSAVEVAQCGPHKGTATPAPVGKEPSDVVESEPQTEPPGQTTDCLPLNQAQPVKLARLFKKVVAQLRRTRATSHATPTAAAVEEPAAGEGWHRLHAVVHAVRTALYDCFPLLDHRSQSHGELEAWVLVALLLRLDLKQTIQFTSTGTTTAPVVWLRVLCGHIDARVTAAVMRSHPTVALKTASEEAYARGQPVKECDVALTLSAASQHQARTHGVWVELVESIETWGASLGFNERARMCAATRPFLTLLSPAVADRLMNMTELYQRVCQSPPHHSSTTPDLLPRLLDASVRGPLDVLLPHRDAHLWQALETTLQTFAPLEWLSAALHASELSVAPYMSLRGDGPRPFSVSSSALVAIKAEFIARHGKVKVCRVSPLLRVRGSPLTQSAAPATATGPLDLFLLSVYDVQEACCPHNGSQIAMSALYPVRKMKPLTSLPLLRLSAPAAWGNPASDETNDSEAAMPVTAIPTFPLSRLCTPASPSLVSSTHGSDSSVSDSANSGLTHTVFVVPPARCGASSTRGHPSPPTEPVCPAKAITPPEQPRHLPSASLAENPEACAALLPVPPEFPARALHDCLQRCREVCLALQARALARWMTSPAIVQVTVLGGPAQTARGVDAESRWRLWYAASTWPSLLEAFHRHSPFASTPLYLWVPLGASPTTSTVASTPLFLGGRRAALQKLRCEMNHRVANALAPLFLVNNGNLTLHDTRVRVVPDAAHSSHPSPTALVLGAEQVAVLSEPVSDALSTATELPSEDVARLVAETPASLFFAPLTASDSGTSAVPTEQYLCTPAIFMATSARLEGEGVRGGTWPASAFARSGTGPRTAPLPTHVVALWDEAQLTVTWSATQLVEALLWPPLRACLCLYDSPVMTTTTMTPGTSQSPPNLLNTALQREVRRCLVCALTDLPTMERYEFVGDALLDYVVSVRTLTLTTFDGTPLWEGTQGATSHNSNDNLFRALPAAIRHFVASAHNISNEKRCADVVEALFGALVAALWTWPLRHGVEPDATRLFRCTSVLMAILGV